MSFLPALTRLMRLAPPLLLVLSVLVSGVAGAGSCGVDHDCCDEGQSEAACQEHENDSDCSCASEAHVEELADGDADPGECSDCPDGCATCHCTASVLGKVENHFAPSLAQPDFERPAPYVVALDAPPEGSQASLFRPPRSQA